MFLEAGELSVLLRAEDDYIRQLKKRWKRDDFTEKTEHDLRMGKRTELLGDLQCKKETERAERMRPTVEITN